MAELGVVRQENDGASPQQHFRPEIRGFTRVVHQPRMVGNHPGSDEREVGDVVSEHRGRIDPRRRTLAAVQLAAEEIDGIVVAADKAARRL